MLGTSLDEALYFLGEIEFIATDYELSLDYFQRADQITEIQQIKDAVAFRIGSIYEATQEYERMAEHFIAYMEKYGERGRLTDAVFELGRAYEFTQQPVKMLALYTDTITKYISDTANVGVDALIESYAEKYSSNYNTLSQTTFMLDKLENDLDFREKVVTDRGFLFELFYLNKTLDQALYNRMRFHPDFTPALIEDLSPLDEITSVYREQLDAFPTETPEDFYRSLLSQARAESNRIAETRALMGLYRIGVVETPSQEFDAELISRLSPRALLYVADYTRDTDLEYAVEVWNEILQSHTTSDSAIVALMRLADISSLRGNKLEAYEYLDQILQLFPGSPKVPGVILRQGELLTELDRYSEARKKYQYILRVPAWRGVAHARALYQTGLSYMAENEYAKAHGFFERTFLGYSQITEWSARAYLEDAKALVEMKAQQDAINTLEEALETLSQDTPTELIEPIRKKLEELQS